MGLRHGFRPWVKGMGQRHGIRAWYKGMGLRHGSKAWVDGMGLDHGMDWSKNCFLYSFLEYMYFSKTNPLDFFP